MWPRDGRSGGGGLRPRGAVAFRTLLCAICLLYCVPASRGQGVGDQSALREKDVKRAEKVLEQLRLLDKTVGAREDGPDFRRLTRKLYPGLFAAVAEMRPGDLKTDIDTAVFLYEEMGRSWPAAGSRIADCERERPDLYLPLCLDLGGGTVRQLLHAKARLHARWAEAVVKTFRGGGDAETLYLLSEVKAARARDLLIASCASATLKSLEGLVNTPPTYADYQEYRTASKVSFEKLDAAFTDALGRTRTLLNWMPRSPVYYYLSSAWRSYVDGLFWYRKVHESRKIVVSAATRFEPDPLEDLRLDAEHVGYAVVVNWRMAAKYMRLAGQSLPGH